jgi:hypothetical protein
MRFGRSYGRLSRWCFRYKRTCLFCLYARWLFLYALRINRIIK